MKCLGISLLLFVFLGSRAQEVFTLPDPDGSMFELRDNWVYKMGDFPDARLPGYNDQCWKPIRPAADIHDSLPADARVGIGWMRLRFKVGDGTKTLHLAFLVHQSVASEIYLDGRLLRKYGNIATGNLSVKAFDPLWEPVPLDLGSESVHVLAVRFAVQPGMKYSFYYGNSNPFISIRFMEYDRALKIYRGIYQRPWIDLFMHGIICMVFILHLCFYILYPAQKANLFFSLAACTNLIANLGHNYFYYGAAPDQKFLLAVLLSVLYGVSLVLTLASIYRYFNLKPGRLFLVFDLLVVCALTLGALWYRNGFIFFLAWVHILCYLVIIIVSVQAWRSKIRESIIPMAGFGIGAIAFVIFLLPPIIVDHRLLSLWDIKGWTFLFVVISPTTAFSMLLAYDFAKTSQKLGVKLAEVENLSERNLEMEKEKKAILETQNRELERKVAERTQALNQSIEDLKSTQRQLIQSEKMASLGELTAGIAHEIQNPLNFVNNFSELSNELIDEMQEEMEKGNVKVAGQIAADIRSNLEKINQHGKRADSIVKGMLQHSRTSSGEKVLTDINVLADEYLRLAFHGFRAKGKSFNANLVTEFDHSLGKVNVIPQEIGRVLLNLLNNAFYAVDKKATQGITGYEPSVTVRTRRRDRTTVIEVEDNGSGIPTGICEKIFHPFFTTKPTGEGTGLGLSLSYDIVKAHGGTIEVESDEGRGSAFRVILPS
jgi:signal transduction histidine kinase